MMGKRFLVLHGHEFGPHYQDSKLNIVLSGLNFPLNAMHSILFQEKRYPKILLIYLFSQKRVRYRQKQ
jgi:hypothetical protein